MGSIQPALRAAATLFAVHSAGCDRAPHGTEPRRAAAMPPYGQGYLKVTTNDGKGLGTGPGFPGRCTILFRLPTSSPLDVD